MRHALILFVAACQAIDPVPDEGRAWVMVEVPAAEAGFVVRHDDWAESPLLPTEIDPLEATWLESPRGDEKVLEVPAGRLGIIRVNGDLDLVEPGVDAPADRLLVRGRLEAVRELADLLDATVEPRGGAYLLAGEDLLARTSFLAVPEGIDEIDLDQGEAFVRPAGFAIQGEHADRQAELVGLFRTGSDLIVLDTEGGFTWWAGGCGRQGRLGRVTMASDQDLLLVADDGETTALRVADLISLGDE